MKPLIIGMFFVLASACGDVNVNTVTRPSPAGISFRGHVFDFATSIAVPNAAIDMHDLNSGMPIIPSVITDANGLFATTSTRFGFFSIRVDGTPIGVASAHGIQNRGDFYITRRPCISRYGVVSDARTLRPVPGATVMLNTGSARTGPDGWYRIDFGCSGGSIGFTTGHMRVTHPRYAQGQFPVGPGLRGVERFDVDLQPISSSR